MKRLPDPLYIRDCYAQIKAVRRIMLTLCDDLGDLAAHTDDPAFEQAADECDAIEGKLHTLQNRLEAASRGGAL